MSTRVASAPLEAVDLFKSPGVSLCFVSKCDRTQVEVLESARDASFVNRTTVFVVNPTERGDVSDFND